MIPLQRVFLFIIHTLMHGTRSNWMESVSFVSRGREKVVRSNKKSQRISSVMMANRPKIMDIECHCREHLPSDAFVAPATLYSE